MELKTDEFGYEFLSGRLCDHFALEAPKGYNPERFMAVFESVWSTIPADCREAMVRCWTARNQTPVVELYYTFDWVSWSRIAVACYSTFQDLGDIFMFWIFYLDLSDAETCSLIIAHELAHGYQHATGYSPQDARKYDRYKGIHPFVDWILGYIDPLEKNARQLTRRWGFSEKAESAWRWRMGRELRLIHKMKHLLPMRGKANHGPRWNAYAAQLRAWEAERTVNRKARKPAFPFSRAELKTCTRNHHG